MNIKSLAGYSIILITTVVFIGCSVSVAADCKGLEQGKCEDSSSCTWVNSYTTQSGKTVSAYCRKKGGKSNTSTAGKTSTDKS
ncbi:hypothetical protein [Desulfogranum japonicum]|uniref:hypothetical protein n=1 Tax=Desulfogranum japonicum TaxID=231447 RepID=UPI000403A4FA|nr:hypothetical protein [Desulfogranum japonicum]